MGNIEAKHILHVDLRRIFDSISTLRDRNAYSLRQMVQRTRDIFKYNYMYFVLWVPTGMNLADSLTKLGPQLSKYRLISTFYSQPDYSN